MKNRFRFRIWDKIDKRFMSGSISIDCRKGCMSGNMPEDKYVIQQCTGLKDKNGKLIYEGDILKTRTGLRLKVIWNKEVAMFWLQTFDDVYTITFYAKQQLDGDEMEVIGNIYENKELLNGN